MSHKWKGFRTIMKVREALETFISSIDLKPTETEYVGLDYALDRVLAEDIRSQEDVPPFDRAAMDGYAVRAEDTYGASQHSPIVLRVIGEIQAGRKISLEVRAGEAVRIHTGAALPKGANAVVEVENSEESGGMVRIYEQVPPFRNVSRRGEDIRAGEVLLPKGTIIGAFELGLLASINKKEVLVRRKPVISMISTGHELIEVGEERVPGKIVNSNRWLVKGIVEENGGLFSYEGIVRDDADLLARRISRCKQANIVVTSGGTSVGTSDFVPDALEKLEAKIVVHGVGVMPGKPTLLAVLSDGRPFIGLPGYPVSAAVGALLFLVPLIERFLGIKGERMINTLRARLVGKVPSRPGILHFARVKLKKSGNEWLATPVRVSGAGIASSLVKADAFLIVPENIEGYKEGEIVEVLPFKRYISTNVLELNTH